MWVVLTHFPGARSLIEKNVSQWKKVDSFYFQGVKITQKLAVGPKYYTKFKATCVSLNVRHFVGHWVMYSWYLMSKINLPD